MTNEEFNSRLIVMDARIDKKIASLIVNSDIIQARADKRMKEHLEEYEAQSKKSRIAYDTRMEKYEIQMAQTDAQMAKTDKKLKEIGIMIGGISNNQGDVAEEFFLNSLIKHNELGKLKFDDVTSNAFKHRGKIQEEYDILLTNGESIAIIEVKYKAHLSDLPKLERKIANFKTLYPVYKDYKIYGALASFHINKDVKKETLEHGYFVLQREGDLICSENNELKTV